MLEINSHYPTTTVTKAREHILAHIPIQQKNQMRGLLTIYQNSIIQHLKNYPPI